MSNHPNRNWRARMRANAAQYAESVASTEWNALQDKIAKALNQDQKDQIEARYNVMKC